MYETKTYPAFENELRGDITDTIDDWELSIILSNHEDRHKDFSGSGHPVNMVLSALEVDERFYLDDDHARPELYAWAKDNAFNIEQLAWQCWGCQEAFEEGKGPSEAAFQERYYIRMLTRKEKFKDDLLEVRDQGAKAGK